MFTKHHLFSKKQVPNEIEAANIKAVRVISIQQSNPAHYIFEIDYKDGTTVSQYSGARLLHDRYAKFLPEKFVQDLHDEIRATERSIMDPDW